MLIYCCKCGDIECDLVNGVDIYPHRPDLSHLNFYKCPECGGYVGCHRGSTRPLGVIPTPDIKRARSYIHGLLDPMWRTRKYGKSRGWWYRNIAKELGIPEYHTGWTRSIEECRDVWRAIKKIENYLSKES